MRLRVGPVMSLQLRENFLSLGGLLAWLYRCTKCERSCWLTKSAMRSMASARGAWRAGREREGLHVHRPMRGQARPRVQGLRSASSMGEADGGEASAPPAE